MRWTWILGASGSAVWVINGAALPLAELTLPGGAMVPVLRGFWELMPVIVLASLLAGALSVTGLASRARQAVGGSTLRAVLVGSSAGALTPVCGIGVVPLIAALHRQGMSLPAIMAFWVSSPVTDPAMLVMTAGVLGIPFAIAKTIAAFGVGMLGGMITAAVVTGDDPGGLPGQPADCAGPDDAPWRRFLREAFINGELAARWIFLALILEVMIRSLVPVDWVAFAAGGDHWWSVPLAATVGALLYLDGYAALPLIRGLADAGMGAGAALAVMISGSVVSLYAAVAVFSVVPTRLFILYLVSGILGAIICGYTADLVGLTVGAV